MQALSSTPWTRTNIASLLVLGVLLLVFGYQGLTDEGGALRPIQDYVITHSFSRQVVENHHYFQDFTYPLPAVILKLWLARPGLMVSSVLWVAAMILAAFAVARACVVLLAIEDSPHAYLVPLLAFLAVIYPVQWDFRAVNSNTLLLALILWSRVYGLRGRPARAGLLLALSVALKLYSIALVPYLLLLRRHRELGWTLGWIFGLFVLLPIAYFGPSDAAKLSLIWLRTLLGTSDASFVVDLIAYKVSFYYVMLALFSEVEMGAGLNLARFTLAQVHAATRVLQLAWLGGVAGFLLWESRRVVADHGSTDHGAGRREGVRELADVGLLLAAMLLLSPLLEPHHPTLLVVLAVVMAHSLCTPGEDWRRRLVMASLLAGSALSIKLAPGGLVKAIGLNVSILAFSLAVMAIRRAETRPATEKPASGA